MKKSTPSLIAFLKKYPELRTWQAIRAWSKKSFILYASHFDTDMFDADYLKQSSYRRYFLFGK